MKATRKTIVTAVLTASMAVSAIPFSASAEEILVDNFAWDVIYNHEKYEEKFKGTTFDDAVREICGGDYMFYTGNPLTAWYPSYQHPVSGFCIDETGTTHMMSGYFTEVMIKVKADTELPLDEIKAVAEENGYNLPTFEKTETGYRMINADDRETADFVMEQIKACGNVLAIDNHYAIWDNTYSIGTAYIRGIFYNGDMTVEELAEEYPSLNLYTPETEDEMEECGLNNTYVIDYSTMTCNQIYEKSAFLPDVIGWEHIKYTSEQIDDIRKLMNSGLDFKFYSKREMPTQANIDVHFSSAASVPVLIDGLKGDANIDGEKNMADAVMIMQSVANPNKYGIKAVNGITAQGSQNGDMDGNGITNADALAIQKDLLKIDTDRIDDTPSFLIQTSTFNTLKEFEKNEKNIKYYYIPSVNSDEYKLSKVTKRDNEYVMTEYRMVNPVVADGLSEYDTERLQTLICRYSLNPNGTELLKNSFIENGYAAVECDGKTYYRLDEHADNNPDKQITGYETAFLQNGQLIYMHIPAVDTFENMIAFAELQKIEIK